MLPPGGGWLDTMVMGKLTMLSDDYCSLSNILVFCEPMPESPVKTYSFLPSVKPTIWAMIYESFLLLFSLWYRTKHFLTKSSNFLLLENSINLFLVKVIFLIRLPISVIPILEIDYLWLWFLWGWIIYPSSELSSDSWWWRWLDLKAWLGKLSFL
jgi:hypothetical protein